MKQYASDKVMIFRSRDEDSELERINRLTGLDFDSLPTSLLLDETGRPQEPALPLSKAQTCND